MPEGDTVWLTAHRLDQALRGRVVTWFDLRVPALALSDLRGATVTEVVARGKHILMRFDGGRTLHSHLRMDGSWRIAAATGAGGHFGRGRDTVGGAGARAGSARAGPAPVAGGTADGPLAPQVAAHGPPGPQLPGRRRGARSTVARATGFDVRAVIGNDEWLATGHRVHDLAIAATADEDRWVGHLGPDVLGPDWDAGRARENLAADPDRPVVEALLDQRNLAGVGNMYAAELLFMARVNPFTRIGDVTDPGVLPALAYRLLRANRDHPEQTSTGRTARGEQHWVYIRTGQPCRRCRTPIVTAEFGVAPRRRSTFWCPRCQPATDAAPT